MKETMLTLNGRDVPVYCDLLDREPDRPTVQGQWIVRTPRETVCVLLRSAATPYFWICPGFHAAVADHEAFALHDVTGAAQCLLDTGQAVEAALVGAPAALLRLALTGRAPDASPDAASPEQARIARRQIQSLVAGDAAYALAQAAIDAFGPAIQPWLGVAGLDGDRRVVWDDPRYNLRIPLA